MQKYIFLKELELVSFILTECLTKPKQNRTFSVLVYGRDSKELTINERFPRLIKRKKLQLNKFNKF